MGILEIAGFVTALTVIGTAIGRGVIILLRFIKNVESMNDSLDKIPLIYDQLFPNGGSSLADKLDRVERMTYANSERLRTLAYDNTEPYFETDASGRIIWVNKIWEEITGVTLTTATGFGWLTAIAPIDRKYVSEEWAAAVSQKRDFSLEFELVKNNAKVHAIAHVIKGIDSEVSGYFGRMSLANVDSKT